MKTEFKFETKKGRSDFTTVAKIVNYAGKRTYIFLDTYNAFNDTLLSVELQGKSLETFAINILKSLKSKYIIKTKE